VAVRAEEQLSAAPPRRRLLGKPDVIDGCLNTSDPTRYPTRTSALRSRISTPTSAAGTSSSSATQPVTRSRITTRHSPHSPLATAPTPILWRIPLSGGSVVMPARQAAGVANALAAARGKIAAEPGGTRGRIWIIRSHMRQPEIGAWRRDLAGDRVTTIRVGSGAHPAVPAVVTLLRASGRHPQSAGCALSRLPSTGESGRVPSARVMASSEYPHTTDEHLA